MFPWCNLNSLGDTTGSLRDERILWSRQDTSMLNSASCPLVQRLFAGGVPHRCAWTSRCSALESRLLLTLGAQSTLSFKVITYLLDVCHFPCYDAFHSGYGEMRKVMYDPSRLNTFFLSASEAEGIHPRAAVNLFRPLWSGLIGLQQEKPCLRPNLQRDAWRTRINTCKEKAVLKNQICSLHLKLLLAH